MKPLAIIRVNGTPLGEQAVERLLSVEVVDEAGDQNDTCKIEFQDDPPVSLPIVGTKVEVSLGWQDVAGATDRMNGVVQRLGEYFLDEIDIEWPPAKVGLTCHAESTASGFKTQKIREWHNTSIGAIVRKIASENGFIPKVDPDFDDTRIPHMDQPNISDMAFLTVLARQYGAVSKVAEGNLFFGAPGTGGVRIGAGNTGRGIASIRVLARHVSGSVACQLHRGQGRLSGLGHGHGNVCAAW